MFSRVIVENKMLYRRARAVPSLCPIMDAAYKSTYVNAFGVFHLSLQCSFMDLTDFISTPIYVRVFHA